jgi:uncharacterized membrane protein YgdD (TMEM256/DUF423 family)
MWSIISALTGASGILLGAFGAHALREHLDPAALATWQTAVQYHILHALALLALSLHARATGRPIALASWLFLAGVVLFSGSLYLLATAGWTWLGPVTPVGGLCLIAGWLSLALLARTRRS